MRTHSLALTGTAAIGIAVALAVLTACGPVQAAFIPIEDFDSLTLGPIDQQNGWYAFSLNSAVVLDPADGTNQVLQVITESTRLYHHLDIPDGVSRMLFLRFRYEDQLNVSFGTCEAQVPDQFGDFDVEMNLTTALDVLRINDGGYYRSIKDLQPCTWYNLWMQIDNDEDVTAVWLHDRDGEPALPGDRIGRIEQAVFAFRDPVVTDMRSFFIKTGGGSGLLGPLHLDDIYLETSDALNLANPADSPTSVPVAAAPPPLRIYPNPFNPRTTVNFELTQAQYVEVLVYDLHGREVALLASKELPPGQHAFIWNGRNRDGHEVPTGIYLIQMRLADRTRACKAVLVR